jgi:membrane protein implicated in regulation of membrane protease activity
VVLGVVLGGLVPMMGRMQSMGVGHMSVMSGLLVIAGFIMLGRFTMMMRGALVVIGGGLVMLAALVRLRAHIAVLLLGALTAKRLLPKSDTRVNARPGGVRARGAEMSRGRAVARHSECGYSGMPALRRPSLIRSCCCRYFGLVSAKGTGDRRRNVDILVSGYLCR